MDNNERIKDWSSRIADFKSSGLTMSVWCTTNKLSIHQLKYWLKKMNIPGGRKKSSTASTQWLPVSLTGNAQESDKTHSLVGSASIEVSANFNPSLLLEIIRTLTPPC
jgi:hypothetical protein